jgi:copper chaperone CopZ
MPETLLRVPTLLTQDDVDVVMFELQDLPCVDMAEVSLVSQTVWVSHTALMTPLDIVAVLEQAGYEASLL